jgi:hypothetical protein
VSDPRRPLPAPLERAPLERAALERVLARAAELQAANSEPAEQLTEAQLVEIGREVGISPEHVRRAIAEERTRVALPEETGLAARVAGPARAAAARVVAGTPEQVLAFLGRTLEREECLQVKRRYGERVTYEARRDLMGSVQRGLKLGGRGYALAAASEISVAVTAVDDGRVLVQLEGDVSASRRQRIAVGSVVAGTGLASGAAVLGAGAVADALLAAVVPLSLLPPAIGAAVGWGVARSHRSSVERVQLALDQLLDRLEHGEAREGAPPSLLDQLLGAASRRVR